MNNTLEPEQSRLGFLFDGDPNTPHIVAQLSNEGGKILLRLPWLEAGDPHHARWFDSLFNSSNGLLPDTLDFYDIDGPVALVGCHSIGATSNLTIGLGRISIDHAVLGARRASKYQTIHGLRSEVEGLGTWMRLRSLKQEWQVDSTGRTKTIDLHLESPAPVRVAQALNLTVRPAYRFGPGDRPDEQIITERMLIETLSKKSRSWEDHFDLHFSLRDLLRVSSWRQLNFLKHEATRDDDPIRTMDGKSHGRQWHKLETSLVTTEPSTPRKGAVQYLFTFDDIRGRGVGRWIKLRRDMSRGIAPIVAILNLKSATIETHISQLGIGLEALGFSIAKGYGASTREAGQERFELRLRRILNDCASPILFDRDDWVTEMTQAYNAVKHANRTLPSPLELIRAYRKGIMVFRIWIANQLGVGPEILKFNLNLDPISQWLAQNGTQSD